MAKKQYYSWDNIYNTDATYLIAIGARNVGKSYDAKHRAIKEAYADKFKRFGLVRRWKEDIKQNLVEQYFVDVPIEDITQGKYKQVRYWQGKIYLANYDLDKMQWLPDKMLIGYTFALSSAQHYKSTMYPDVQNLLFEEFISDTFYLPDEPKQLDSLVSTIARGREIKVFCIGNSISRMSPYYRHWQLEHAIHQPQGTIDVYDNTAEDGTVVKVAVEMCDNVVPQKMFFGKSQNMIVNGHWQADEHPSLSDDFEMYETRYELFIFHESLKYRCRLFRHKDNHNYVWYIEPFTKDFKHKKGTRIISDIYSEDVYVTKGFQPLNDKERNAFNLIKLGKVAFSDNLTGTEFFRILDSIN